MESARLTRSSSCTSSSPTGATAASSWARWRTATGQERIVAVGEYDRLRDPAAAEAAFAVADDLQGRGIGTRLLERLAALAAGQGIERFVANVQLDNPAMLGVFESAGLEVTRELDGGEFEVSFPIEATEQYRTRVDERDHLAVTASLRPFFEPGSIAVIGASRRRGSIGGELFRNVLAADFIGSAYPVNRDGEPVGGVRAYSSIADVPDVVDLVVICLPGPLVLDAAEAALSRGVKALCVISSGFAEVGAEGLERQERLLALVRAHGGRLVGPNCLGIAVPHLGLNATFGPRPLPPGPIAFSSQSGALGLALLEKASERNLGFSAFVSIGNKADVSSNDLLEWWEDDDETEVVLLYLESFGNPHKFARLARRIARSKPVLALKAGSTEAGARAASSHTAALASSDTAVEALFRQAGVIRADTLEELVDAAALLSSQPLPRGRRVGVLTNAGGLGILCADACARAGLELPELGAETQAALRPLLPDDASLANPVDLLGSATGADVRVGHSGAARGQASRCPDRPLRPSRRRRSRRGGRCDSRRRRTRWYGQARARGTDQSGRNSSCPPGRGRRRRLLRVSRVGRPRARPRGGSRGMASSTGRNGSSGPRRRHAEVARTDRSRPRGA